VTGSQAEAPQSNDEGLPAFGEDGGEVGASIPKLPTGIDGFDDLSMGGLPQGRATVLAGQSGSAKTVFAGQFLAGGVRRGQPGVFVSLEEPVADLRANLETLGHDVAAWERAQDWAFVDASPVVHISDGGVAVEPYRLDTLAAQIGHAVDATGAQRLVIDSINGVLSLHPDISQTRQLLRALISSMRKMGLTVVLTVETARDPSLELSSYGVEEFVADNVVLLHNIREGRVRRRTVEVLKMRGAMHHKGEASFTVLPGRGVVVLPVPREAPVLDGDRAPIGTGIDGLDAMLGGGLLDSSAVLVAGPTGTGKTLLATEFLAAGLEAGERALLLSYEESRDQALGNAAGWGHDFAAYEQRGLLQVASFYPDAASLDDHLVEIQDLVRRFRPTRLGLDSLTALERLGTGESFREFATRLASMLKQERISSLMTLASGGLPSDASQAETHIAGLSDAIILLRHVEVDSVMQRAIAVLKLRGAPHDDHIRSFTVGSAGMDIGEPFPGVAQMFPSS
jgi:circadian clock protein KaiC